MLPVYSQLECKQSTPAWKELHMDVHMNLCRPPLTWADDKIYIKMTRADPHGHKGRGTMFFAFSGQI